VGDAAREAAVPATGASGAGFTCTAKGTVRPSTTARADQTPGSGNVAAAT
jgi:hypothetical protein